MKKILRNFYVLIIILLNGCSNASLKPYDLRAVCVGLPIPVLPPRQGYTPTNISMFLFQYERYYYEHNCYKEALSRVKK